MPCGSHRAAIFCSSMTPPVLAMSGCAISIASASMMTDALQGLTISQAHALISRVQAMFTDEPQDPAFGNEEWRALEGVRDYPSRIKCATLAWTALEAALHDKSEEVTTE